MLTGEDDVEIHALKARGWSVAAISRHTGRDPKTIRKYLAGEGDRQNRTPAASCLEPFRAYVEARIGDDPHLDATVLHRELAAAGFERSYPTLVREPRHYFGERSDDRVQEFADRVWHRYEELRADS